MAEPFDHVEPADGSAKASTQDGVFEHADVDDAPLLQGTDPLSDDAIDERSPGPRRVWIAFFGVLAVVFAVLLVTDVADHSWGRATQGFLVVSLSCYGLVRELRRASRR